MALRISTWTLRRGLAEVCREQEWLATLEQQHQSLRKKTVRPLYRHIHPSRNLETLKGVGQDSAAVYASFIGEAERFSSTRVFRGWSGMVPDSAQSEDLEAKGLHITQAGPDLSKKFAYLDAEIARRWDPQIAAIYYDQMINKGNHHKQAVCACATHLLDRVLVVLREDKAYEVRDVDGTEVDGRTSTDDYRRTLHGLTASASPDHQTTSAGANGTPGRAEQQRESCRSLVSGQ